MDQQSSATTEAPVADAPVAEPSSESPAEATPEAAPAAGATPVEAPTEAIPAEPSTEASEAATPTAPEGTAPTTEETPVENSIEGAAEEKPQAVPVPLPPATPRQEPPASPMDVAAATAVASAAAIQQELTSAPPMGHNPAPVAPRYDGPPRRGDDTKKVFVGGLPREADKPALDEYFSQFGPVEDSVVMMDRFTGRSRGFGFVTFETKEQMLGCVAAAPHVIMGKTVEVRRSINDDGTSTANERRSAGKGSGAPRSYDDYSSGKGKGGHRDQNPNKLFVGGLPREVTSDVLRDFFIQYGNLVDCTVITDRMTGQSRGFGYITYEDLAAAEAAISNSANNVIDGKWVDVKHTTREAPRQSFGGYNEYGSGGGYGDHGRFNRGSDDYQATMQASRAASNAYFQQQQQQRPMGMYQQPQYGMPPPQQQGYGMQQGGGYGGMGYQRQEQRRPPMGGYNTSQPPRYGGSYGGPSRASPY
ncbi:Nucleolysin TIAR, putative [Perkinsus marinus ATCC 50983]|uniref:Nucleolysin TIAR, putative n=1 Tax=Perkinsus marinus (strain ATCC 50983 / TXsc) TaxID=423536 RepID=C5LR00_PERM5|nr:Nucleolysin TIAR, putative [Perkinsus marinus ATCC 50983]EER00885.1 Nucleolysin TIAR, putative [Perkinsus marinus ATCC 50983]|eukprot:XP_002768167.1 Nucleolysin TIAR, putative [Perkinsus marinus ATCC 50983]